MQKIGTRLREAREKAGYTVKDMADFLGMSHRGYTYYEQGRTIPKMDTMKQIAERLKVTLEWIIEDIDESEQNVPNRTTGEELRLKKAIGEEKDEGLIFVPIFAQAGYVQHYLEPIFINKLEKTKIPFLPYRGNRFRVFEVSGDSMEPTLKENFHVICEYVEPEYWDSTPDFYIHVIVTKDRIMIKRTYRKKNGDFTLISDNQTYYPQFVLPKHEIREMWIVKRKIDWELAPPVRIEIDQDKS